MATIRAYTTIEQSRRLAEILPLESADMIWYGIYRGMDGEHHLLSDEYNEFGLIAINKEFYKTLFRIGDEFVDWLPCWSIAALLGVLPKGTNISTPKPINALSYCCWNQYDEIYADNPVDACYEMILKLNELKML